MTSNIDVIVIGTGEAARPVAYACREAGRSVAVIDSLPFGGTCERRGCDPKKVLVGVSELIDWIQRPQVKGAYAPAMSVDWSDLIRFKRTFTDPVPHENEQNFEEAGITAFHGRAHFVDRTSLEVDGERLVGRSVVIATGARPATLGIPGAELLSTSSEFLEMDQLPRRVAFVGGGYIAFEFAHIAARSGAQVHVLHRGDRPLEQFDPDLVAMLAQATRELDVEIRLQTEVTAVERQAGGLLIHARTGDQEQLGEADLGVQAAGPVADSADLDLDAAGVTHDKSGIAVNEYLQSVSNPAVYAAGDAVSGGGFPLTPVAGMQGSILASNLLKGNHRTVNYTGIPTVVFTTPPLSRAGLTEEAAHAQGLHFVTHHDDTSSWYSSLRGRLPPTPCTNLLHK